MVKTFFMITANLHGQKCPLLHSVICHPYLPWLPWVHNTNRITSTGNTKGRSITVLLASEVGHICCLISLMVSLTNFQIETKTTLQMLKADKLECLSIKRLSNVYPATQK
jgi:hypothetical protein